MKAQAIRSWYRSNFGSLSLVLALSLLPAGATAQAPQKPPEGWSASGHQGAVSAGGSGSVDAGIEILQSGGNAVDAAVATILALTVTDATSVCFGGEVPIMIYMARTGTVEVIAGQGAAPALATREAFHPDGTIPEKGIKPAAVPALLDACLTALERHGTISFARASAPMLRLLDHHEKPWHADLARTVRGLIAAEEQAEGDRRRGLRLVADTFYRGPIADEIGAWCERNGGLLRKQDFARHVTRVEEPVTVGYRGYQVFKCGPWTQGPFLLETLQLLEGFELKRMGHNSPDAIHVTVEAMKLALADRDTFYGDPLFVDVPMEGLLNPHYAQSRRGLIDTAQASMLRRPGAPQSKPKLPESGSEKAGPGSAGRDTTTCVTWDHDGNVVAATPSGWSGVLAGDTGVWLGTRLQSFNLWPGHPNCIEPGKRPRITLTPTIVTRDRKPVLAVSVAGGDNQDMMSIQLVLNHIDFDLSPSSSVTAPRFMSDHFIGSFRQAAPDLGGLRVNPELGSTTLDELARRGHKLKPSSSPLAAAPSVIAIDPGTGTLQSAGDPRAGRHARAY